MAHTSVVRETLCELELSLSATPWSPVLVDGEDISRPPLLLSSPPRIIAGTRVAGNFLNESTSGRLLVYDLSIQELVHSDQLSAASGSERPNDVLVSASGKGNHFITAAGAGTTPWSLYRNGWTLDPVRSFQEVDDPVETLAEAFVVIGEGQEGEPIEEAWSYLYDTFPQARVMPVYELLRDNMEKMTGRPLEAIAEATARDVLTDEESKPATLSVQGLDFSSDGELFLIDTESFIIVREVEDGRLVRKIRKILMRKSWAWFAGSGEYILHFSPDGFDVYDTYTGHSLIGSPLAGMAHAYFADHAPIFSPNRRYFSFSYRRDKTYTSIWYLDNDKDDVVQLLNFERPNSGKFYPKQVALSNSLAIVGRENGEIHWYSLSSQEQVHVLKGGHKKPVRILSFSSRANLVVSASPEESKICLWPIGKNHPSRCFHIDRPNTLILDVTLSDDGTQLFVGARDTQADQPLWYWLELGDLLPNQN